MSKISGKIKKLCQKIFMSKAFELFWRFFLYWIVSTFFVILGFIAATVIGLGGSIFATIYVIFWPLIRLYHFITRDSMDETWLETLCCCVVAVPMAWSAIMPEVLISAGWIEEDDDYC
jgi:hypothetical protein